jgi:hypothetical protein
VKPMQWISVVIALSVANVGTAWADRDDQRGGGRRDENRGGEHHDRGSERGHGDHDAAWLGIPLGILLFSELLAHPPRPDQAPPVVYPPAYYPPEPAYSYYPPAPVYVPAPPPPVVQAYWYYCPTLGNYYPYVRNCPGGWQQVLPQALPR